MPDAPGNDPEAQPQPDEQLTIHQPATPNTRQEAASGQAILTVQGSLLVTTVKSGLLLVHLRRARERIWYERLEAQWQGGDTPSQRLLFPISLELPPADAPLLAEALHDLKRLGFDIAPFGASTFVIQGLPPGLPAGEEQGVIEEITENMKHASSRPVANREQALLLSVARRFSFGANPTGQEALQAVVDELFACYQPEFTAGGKKIFTVLPKDELDGMLGT